MESSLRIEAIAKRMSQMINRNPFVFTIPFTDAVPEHNTRLVGKTGICSLIELLESTSPELSRIVSDRTSPFY